MNIINNIFWQEDKIGVLTNQLESIEHSHYMLQLFICLDNIEVLVNDKQLNGYCLIVDRNIKHHIKALNKIYFTLIIEPTTSLAYYIRTNLINDEGYYINRKPDTAIDKKLNTLINSVSTDNYLNLLTSIFGYLKFEDKIIKYDSRIEELINIINICQCDDHTINNFANKLSLSSSRLSHLFKEQVGMPLKSYILLHQMQRAITLLYENKNISEAALLAGFDSPSHLSATVKKMMGMKLTSSLKDSVFLKVE